MTRRPRITPKTTRPCEVCGQPVTGRADVKMHPSCRVKAARRRKAAGKRAEA